MTFKLKPVMHDKNKGHIGYVSHFFGLSEDKMLFILLTV